ncbi:MAG TPA: response regulator [Ktedonobacterales bacterium]
MVDNNLGDVRERAHGTRTLVEPAPFFMDAEGESPPVMVIDDSPAVRSVVEISLKRVGIPAVAFEGGLPALAALSDGVLAPPRVLLLDIGMPKMDGYEVARVFRTNRALTDVRIIMLSGHDGILDRARAKLVGASDFIAKPFRAAELVRRVCVALGMVEVSWE